MLVETMQARFPDRFGGAYWDDGGHLVLQFKDGAPSGASDVIDGFDPSARSEGVRYSESEADALVYAMAGELRDAGVTATVAMEGRSQRFVVVAGSGQRLHGVAADNASVSAHLASRFPGVDADVQVVDGATTQNWSARGGDSLLVGSSLVCTAGFTVALGTQSGTRGIVTAAHCPNSINRVLDRDTSESVPTFRDAHQAAFGDMQWHTTSTTEVDDFYTSPTGASRDVTDVVTIAAGDTYFYWGWGTSHLWSSNVKYTSVSLTDENGITSGNHFCMVGGSGGPGDSGGPAYVSNSAAGIVKGGATIDGSLRACFTKATRFDDGLNVVVVH